MALTNTTDPTEASIRASLAAFGTAGGYGPPGAVAGAGSDGISLSNLPPRELGSTDRGPESIPEHYWRRPDGWIVVGPGSPTEFQTLSEMGFTSLKRYVQFSMADTTGPYRRDDMRAGGPLSALLQAGGAREFCVEQIVALGWDKYPPLVYNAQGQRVPVVFPQLEGVQVHETECSVCHKRFQGLDEQLVHDNLRRHEGVMHRDVTQHSELARILDKSTVGRTAPIEATLADTVRMLAEGQMQMQMQLQATQAALTAVLERLALSSAPAPAGAGAGASGGSPKAERDRVK